MLLLKGYDIFKSFREIFFIHCFLWVKNVVICRKHTSVLGQSLKWIDLIDAREYWSN